MELLISGLVSIVIMEAYAWLPRLSDVLLDRAVGRLRKRDQDRCREEWMAGLDTLPNTFARLIHAIGLIRAARRIGDDSVQAEFEALDAEIRAVADHHAYMVDVYNQARVQLNCSGRRLAGLLDDLCAPAKAFSNEKTFPNGMSGALAPQSAATIEAYSKSLFAAHSSAMQVKLLGIEDSHRRLDDVKGLIEEAAAKLDATRDARLRVA